MIVGSQKWLKATSRFCDVFCESTALSVDESQDPKGRPGWAGLTTRTACRRTGGALLAAELALFA